MNLMTDNTMTKGKRKNDIQWSTITTQKAKDWRTRTPTETGGVLERKAVSIPHFGFFDIA
jgi:hypothetical protein